MNARRIVKVSAVWFLRWMLDILLIFTQLAGITAAAVGATRIYQAAKGMVMTTSIVPDQALFYVGMIVFMLATYARWELRK